MQTLQALCSDCHSKKTLRESAQPTSLESRVAPGVMEYARSPKLPPLVFEAQTCKKDALYVGVDVARCRTGSPTPPSPCPSCARRTALSQWSCRTWALWRAAVVRNVCLYTPNYFGFLVSKPCETAKFFNQLNVFPMSPVLVTAPFLVQKALKTANSEKFVFSCQTSKVAAEPPSSLVFCRKPAPRSPCSEIRFLPRKACEFQPAELVAACHRFVTTRFLGAKVRKTGPSSRAPSPQGFSRPDSPPRTIRQPAEVVRQPAELVTTEVTAPSGSVFWCKKRSKRSSPKSPFFVSDCKWDAQASKYDHLAQFSAFGPEKRRIPARRACHRLSPLCHRSLWGRKVRKSAPSSERTWFLAS